MQKKKIGVLAMAAVAVAGLASCGPDNVQEPVNGNLNIYLNYQAANGVSFRETSSYYNPLDKITYTQGDLLPTWKAFSKNLGVSITDVAEYSANTDNNVYTAVDAKSYLGANGEGIDLFYNSLTNIKKMANAGKAIDLYPYLMKGEMPNLAQYLSDNPEVFDMIATYTTQNGVTTPHFYYTPYFDGYQQVERMFIMDTEMVTRLLDGTATGDTAAAIGENRLSAAAYKPFIDATNNYPDAETEVVVANSAENTATIKVKQTTNIIAQQNEVLTAGSTTTGANLLAQFKAYLTAAYGDAGYGTSANPLSNIFVGQNACYNADDLIALMRIVRANPKTATGQTDCESVTTLFPRGQAANRMENIYDFASIWGLQGLDGESGNFYFDGDGKLVNLSGTTAAYDALSLLNQIYSEGLISSSFYEKPEQSSGTYYSNSLYANTSANSGAGFMMYDYCASTTVGNDKDTKGVGTAIDDRKGVYEGASRKGIRPVLQPLTYWATGSSKPTEHLTGSNNAYNANRSTEMTLMRYAESNRGLKSNSWCIPLTAQNIPAAIRMMDYLYSAEGSRINDFGPIEFQGPTSTTVIAGQYVPTLSQDLINAYLDSGTDFWTYMRKYIGSTNGIGSVRSDALDMQATNEYAQVGLSYLQNAIRLGVVTLAKCTTADLYNFSSCVPSSWTVSENSSDAETYKLITDFWNAGSTGNSQWRKIVTAGAVDANGVSTIVNETTKLTDVMAQMDTYNIKYTAVFSNSLNRTPEWLNTLING